MKKIFKSNLLILISGLLFLGAGFLLWYQYTNTPLPKILGSQKQQGTLIIEAPDVVQVSQPFTISILVNTNNQPANAVGTYLHFEPDHLQLLRLNTKQSFCQFYPEKKFDNNLGTISLACGSPHPGLTGQNHILRLEFMPLMTGTTRITTDPKSQILLSDGKGTNILSEYPQTDISVVSSF